MEHPFSCLPVSLFGDFFEGRLTLKKWSEIAKTAGFSAIDINRRCLTDKSLSEIGEEAKTLKLPILMVTTYSDFSNPDRDARETALRGAENDVRAAAALGAKFLRPTAGQYYPGEDDRETVRHIAECFDRICREAEKEGVEILIENHSKPGAWQYPDFNFHFERMMLLWEEMRALPVGVNYDTANAFAVGGWKEQMRAFGQRIRTVHVNDLDSVDPLHFCLAGTGAVPLKEQFIALHDLGFDGPFSLEEAGMQGEEGIFKAAANTKALLEEAGFQVAGPEGN